MNAARKLLIVLLTVAVLPATGCGDTRILEKMGFIHTTAYDLAPAGEAGEEDKLRVTIAVPKADPDGRIQRETMTAVVASSKEARIQFSRQSELSLVSGQLRGALFGAALARKGLMEHIDTLVRDPAISQRVKISVVNGSAYELLFNRYPDHPRPGQYIDRMLDKEAAKMMIPTVTLYDFTRDLYDDGIDSVAPIIKRMGGNITLDGIALFQGDKYVSRIAPEDVLIFSILRRNFKKGEISINLKDTGQGNERLLFSSIINSRKVKIEHDGNGGIRAHIQVFVKGSVLEYMGDLEIGEEDDRRKLELLIADYFERRTMKLLANMQKHRADGLGIGQHVRNGMSYEEWEKLNWDELYPAMEIDCRAKVVIKHFGKFM
jgi:spore germination protein